MDRANSLDSGSGGGVAGTHPEIKSAPVFVAPATAGQRNVIVNPLVPIACWRVDDIRFDFDSSFVLPEVADEMSALADLRDKHTLQVAGSGPADPGVSIPPPLSLFGHADPTGSDDYNKQLSGRRATAIYGMLTRTTSLWEKLYSQSLGGDAWGSRSIRTMLTTVDPTLSADSNRLQQQMSDSQSSSGARSSLFSSYMDQVCGTLKLAPDDFLGAGGDSGGKADYQGCGKFNPVVLFSQEEEQEFTNPDKKEKRDAQNAPNRRVLGLLFRPGSKVNPSKWPCPRVSEGTSGCIKRFWSDGEARRSTHLSGKRRRFEKTNDTFACRFYHRISSDSPCERVENLIQIQLLYEDQTPMANAQYKAVFDETSLTGTTDKNGMATIASPKNAPREFMLFLTSFPEKYSDAGAAGGSSGAAMAAEESGTQARWPHSILASLVAALLLWGTLSPANAQSNNLPPVSVVLNGPVYQYGGTGSIQMALTLDPLHPSGTVIYSGQREFTMLNTKLEVLEVSGAAQDTKARYRLQYEADLCEHAPPSRAGAPMHGWDSCFYIEGNPRPSQRIQAEALLIRERLPQQEVLVAIGTTDVRSLVEAFRVSGNVAR